MINLFHINSYTIDTGNYSNLLHDPVVMKLEKSISDYVGAKYAVSFNSATSAIFLSLLDKKITVSIPSIIPPVVLNAIITSGNEYRFIDNVKWVGDSYILYDFGDYKIVDSAQKLQKNQFKEECNDDDLMIFSFYPTKPVGSCDGGIIVSNDIDKIDLLREMSFNGMSYSENNWDRKIKRIGYKMYMSSIQGDIALRNFMRYDEKLKRLKEIRDRYNDAFNLQNTSYHLYRLNVSNRESFIGYMATNGICVGIHYYAAHMNPIYAIDGTQCLLSEKESNTTVSIPFNENLKDNEIDYVINKYKGFENEK